MLTPPRQSEKESSATKTVKIPPNHVVKNIYIYCEGLAWLVGGFLDSLFEKTLVSAEKGGRFIDSCENMKSVVTDYRAPPDFCHEREAKVVDVRNIMARRRSFISCGTLQKDARFYFLHNRQLFCSSGSLSRLYHSGETVLKREAIRIAVIRELNKSSARKWGKSSKIFSDLLI